MVNPEHVFRQKTDHYNYKKKLIMALTAKMKGNWVSKAPEFVLDWNGKICTDPRTFCCQEHSVEEASSPKVQCVLFESAWARGAAFSTY